MRILIDGYNLMYANGLLCKQLGPDGLRKARHRFLSDLAARLGEADARGTTVVFDAAEAPGGLPTQAKHLGLTVLYAVDEDDADERIEQLIAGHSAPKTLTVVSTDRRIRQAAQRRKANAVTSEDYWTALDEKRRQKLNDAHRSGRNADAAARHRGLTSDQEAAFWLEEFAEIATDPEVHRELAAESDLLTDSEIAQIQREVDREFGPQPPAKPRSRKPRR